MDEIVKAALKKWPNVPHCHGWLGLDARGDWYMRDASVQAAGPFPQVKGNRVTLDKLKAFIERNYLPDEQGAWFFQNGPQRVYVALEAAPWVLGVRRVEGAAPVFEVATHTGQAVQHIQASWVDEQGRLFLDTDVGLGLVRSLDMDAAADAIEAGVWPALQETLFAELPARHGYVLQPRAPDAPA
jgi:hypothetical protein